MIPETIQQNLAKLRRRERGVELSWGAARWLAIVVLALVTACTVDYLVDRTRETPWGLRRWLLIGELTITLAAAAYLLAWPLRKRLSDDELALWVEEKHPDLRHRLISAVQLNRPGAHTEGMSPELIGVVTREAEQQAQKRSFAEVADLRRLRWTAAAVVPALLVVSLPFVLFPQVAGTLLARHFLADRDLPRFVNLENATPEYWPSGEKVVLTIKATGAHEKDTGVVTMLWDQNRPEVNEQIPLQLARRDLGTGVALYTAELGPFSEDFAFAATMKDGRLKRPGHIHFVARPVVVKQEAWVQLPAFVGARPDGSPYEKEMPRGEVTGIPGSKARVVVKIQKPVTSVRLELIGPVTPQSLDKANNGKSPEKIPEKVWRTVAMRILPRQAESEEGTWAEAVFDLRPEETVYRIVAVDEHGFVNQPAPRRGIRLVPEDPPVITLLRELFPPLSGFNGGPAEDFEVEGLPLLPGVPIKLAYTCTGNYGLGRVNFLYRVFKQRESGNDGGDDEPWTVLPLQEVVGSAKTGPFDPRRGAFQYSTEKDSIGFHAVPSIDPMRFPGRTLGGGRYIFQTKFIVPDGAGGFQGLKPGEQIEYCLEVFADKDPSSKRPSAKSETRVKTVVSGLEFARWIEDTLQEERRIRQLDLKQRGIFDEKK